MEQLDLNISQNQFWQVNALRNTMIFHHLFGTYSDYWILFQKKRNPKNVGNV